jgi:hypothetical protein
MNLFKKTTATIALVALVSGIFSAGVSASSSTEVEAANALAASWYIVNHSTDAAAYNLNQNVLRQEIAAVARGIAGLEKTTSVIGTFSDVTATTPNTWAVYSVEALAEAGLIAKNPTFNPEANISKAEAIGMMVKAAFGSEYAYDSSKATSWQEQVVDFAVSKGVVSSFTNYDTAATRGFVFEAGNNAMIASTEVVEACDEVSQLLGLCDEDTVIDDTTEDDTTEDDTTVVISGDNVLFAELSATTPVAQNIPSTAANVEFMAFDVTAGSEDVTLNSIVLKRVGLGSRSDFKKVWLSQDGVVVSNDKTISSDDTVTITTNLSVKAGSTETFVVNASMNGAVSTVNAFEIVDVTATSNVDMGTVRGFGMTTVNYTVAQVTLTPKGTASTIDAGEENEIIGEFKLEETATDSKKDAIVKSIRFKTTWGLNISDNLENIALYKDGSIVSTATIIDDDYVTFKLDNLLIEDAKSIYFEIKADVKSGDDGDTVAFSIKDDFDIYAIESGTAIGTSVEKGATLPTYTLNAGKITISQDISTPSSNEYISDTDWVLVFVAKVDTDQAVLVDSLRLFLDASTHIEDTLDTLATDNQVGDLDASIENVRVYRNDTLIDSVDTITQAVTTTRATDDIDTANDYYNFDSSFELSDNDLIKVYVDVTKDVATTTQIKFKLNNVGSAAGTSPSLLGVEYVTDGETLVQAKLTGSATSNVAEIVAASAGTSIVRNDGFSSQTFLAGQQGATLMKFVVNAGNSSSLEINKLNFDATRTWGVYTDFVNFKLLKNGSQVGGTEDLGSTDSFTITDINTTIAQGAQATFELVADIDTSSAAKWLTVALDASDSVFYDSNNNEVTTLTDVTGDSSIISDNAILAAAIDGDTAEEAILIAGTTGVEIAKYKFTATDGDVNIKDLYFMNQTTGADSRISSLKLVVNGYIVDSRVPSNDQIHFNLGSASKIVVAKNSDVIVSVVADFNTITSASQTNKTIVLELTDIKADTAATSKAITQIENAEVDDDGDTVNGGQSNSVVSIDTGDHYTTSDIVYDAIAIDSNKMYIRKTQATVATQQLSTTKLTNGEQSIYKFTVSADSKAAVDIAAIDFDVVTTATITAGSYKLFINGTDKTADLINGEFVDTKATFSDVVDSSDYVSVKIKEDTTTPVAATKADTLSANNGESTFVWSDNSASPHSDTTADYFNGKNVNGLDTATTTLSY